MPGISIHVVDVTRGEPAAGMQVRVIRLPADGAPPGQTHLHAGGGAVGASGLVDDPALGRGDGVVAGVYQLELKTGDYYRQQGLAGTPAFQETVVYRFGVLDPAEHVHLPIKLSPWGLSVWRGK